MFDDWIDVEDCLPRRHGEYLVTFRDDQNEEGWNLHTSIAFYSSADQTFNGTWQLSGKVTAWQSLPRPYMSPPPTPKPDTNRSDER